MTNKPDKRELPEIINNRTIEKKRRSKTNKSKNPNQENENEDNIRQNIEMPSIKRISSKQSIRSPKRSSRRKLFANSTSDSLDTVEQARLQLQHLDTITTSNQKENIKNSTDKAKKKKINETPSNNNNLNDKEIITVSDGETKVKRKRKTRAELRVIMCIIKKT